MASVWVQRHDGKVVIVHPGGYLAFTPEEWQDLKQAGDMALCDEEPPPARKPKVIPGWLAVVCLTLGALAAALILGTFFVTFAYMLTHGS